MKTRRTFIKQAGDAGAAVALPGPSLPAEPAAQPAPGAASAKKPLRLGFVGVGMKGSSHVVHLMRMEGLEFHRGAQREIRRRPQMPRGFPGLYQRQVEGQTAQSIVGGVKRLQVDIPIRE